MSAACRATKLTLAAFTTVIAIASAFSLPQRLHIKSFGHAERVHCVSRQMALMPAPISLPEANFHHALLPSSQVVYVYTEAANPYALTQVDVMPSNFPELIRRAPLQVALASFSLFVLLNLIQMKGNRQDMPPNPSTVTLRTQVAFDEDVLFSENLTPSV